MPKRLLDALLDHSKPLTLEVLRKVGGDAPERRHYGESADASQDACRRCALGVLSCDIAIHADLHQKPCRYQDQYRQSHHFDHHHLIVRAQQNVNGSSMASLRQAATSLQTSSHLPQQDHRQRQDRGQRIGVREGRRRAMVADHKSRITWTTEKNPLMSLITHSFYGEEAATASHRTRQAMFQTPRIRSMVSRHHLPRSFNHQDYNRLNSTTSLS